jgi:hypothetical protein
LGTRKVKAPTRWIIPEVKAKNNKKRVTSKPVDESVKYLDASTERKSGERPKTVILAPDAAPRYWGKSLEAAKRDEK